MADTLITFVTPVNYTGCIFNSSHFQLSQPTKINKCNRVMQSLHFEDLTDRCVMKSLILPTESDACGNVDAALGLVPGSHIYGNLNGTRTEGEARRASSQWRSSERVRTGVTLCAGLQGRTLCSGQGLI